MSSEEILLRDLWISLFQSDLVAKVKGVDKKVLGPFLLIERAVVAFKDVGSRYVQCVEELTAVKSKLDAATENLSIANERLNETQKPCELCETLSKELSLAKSREKDAETRAKDAEDRVTQIAQILVFRSSNDDKARENMVLPGSPKRKKSCVRDKEDELDISSQVVEIGCSQTAHNINSTQTPLRSISPVTCEARNSPMKGVKRLSKSFDDNNEIIDISRRKNLSADIPCQTSPRKSSRLASKENNRVEPDKNTLADNFCSELDKIWFDEPLSCRNKEGRERVIPESPISPIEVTNKPKETSSFTRGSKKKTSRVPLKNPDNSYDILFEKKVRKKKMKQLTLGMTAVSRRPDPLSDTEDIILPSPDKLLDETKGDGMVEFIKGLQSGGISTSTQRPVADLSTKMIEKKTGGCDGVPVSSRTGGCDGVAVSSRTGGCDVVAVSSKTGGCDVVVASSRTGGCDSLASSSKDLLDNSYDVIRDKERKPPSPDYKYIGKTVRGKARAQLEGWDCDDCKRYYEVACKNQSPSKVKATMNLCSRHRSKYKHTRPPTPPGFWDLSIQASP